MGKHYQLNQTKFLNEVEVKALEARLFRAKDPMERVIILVALNTGGRASEVLRLRKEDMMFTYKSVYIRGLKGSNDREIPLTDALWTLLVNYSNTISGESLFPISLRQFSRIWHKHRPCPKKLHSLRHTFAIRIYRKHRDLRLVQVALGHRNIQNTMVYAEYQYATSELRKLIC